MLVAVLDMVCVTNFAVVGLGGRDCTFVAVAVWGRLATCYQKAFPQEGDHS